MPYNSWQPSFPPTLAPPGRRTVADEVSNEPRRSDDEATRTPTEPISPPEGIWGGLPEQENVLRLAVGVVRANLATVSGTRGGTDNDRKTPVGDRSPGTTLAFERSFLREA